MIDYLGLFRFETNVKLEEWAWQDLYDHTNTLFDHLDTIKQTYSDQLMISFIKLFTSKLAKGTVTKELFTENVTTLQSFLSDLLEGYSIGTLSDEQRNNNLKKILGFIFAPELFLGNEEIYGQLIDHIDKKLKATPEVEKEAETAGSDGAMGPLLQSLMGGLGGKGGFDPTKIPPRKKKSTKAKKK